MLQKCANSDYLESKGSGRGATYHIPSAKVAISSPNKATSNANMATYVGSNTRQPRTLIGQPQA